MAAVRPAALGERQFELEDSMTPKDGRPRIRLHITSPKDYDASGRLIQTGRSGRTVGALALALLTRRAQPGGEPALNSEGKGNDPAVVG